MRGSLRRRDRRRDQHGPERWELRVFLERDERGRQHRRSRAFCGTRREAESALAAFVIEVERGRQAVNSKLRFAEYATRWLDGRAAAGELAPKTLERYRGILRDHLLPPLGMVPLRRIGVSQIRAALGTWRSGPRRDRKRGYLSEKSVHDQFALLKQILGEAVRERLILDNPAAFVRAPGTGGSKRRTYTMAQLLALVDHLAPTALATPVFVKALTGLRRGELLALRWTNVDLDAAELQVSESLERLRDGTLRFKRPKTKHGERLIAYPSCVAEVLGRHRAEQEQSRQTLGQEGPPTFVFGTLEDAPWDPDVFSSAFAYALKQSGLPRISLQELRHTYSSLSDRAGNPLKTTSESMGHATTAITADRYTHAVLEDLHKGADRLQQMYEATRRDRYGAHVLVEETPAQRAGRFRHTGRKSIGRTT